VDYAAGLQAVERLKAICPSGMSMTQFALRWILMFDAVTCAIPGAKRPAQVDENFSVADLPPIPSETMDQVRAIYEQDIHNLVHHYW
jgi:aryl-alcohol dehydrogenase-like predicted oxidoreductase